MSTVSFTAAASRLLATAAIGLTWGYALGTILAAVWR